MRNCIKYLLAAAWLFAANICQAQDAEMADTFRADGKIYVVVAIILIVLIGLFGYLFFLDKKLTRMEKQLGDRQTK